MAFRHKSEIQLLQSRIKFGVADFSKNEEEDRSLVDAYKNGDEQASFKLIDNYLDVISFIYRYPFSPPRKKKKHFLSKVPHMNLFDREDLLQEILYHFFVLIHEYDFSLGKPFEALVKGKLHHRVFNYFFKEFLINKREENYNEDLEAFLGGIESILLDEAIEKMPAQYIVLYQALNQLGLRQREVIILSEMKGWNSNEIAQELDIMPTTVRRTKQDALRKLKKSMGKECTLMHIGII